MVRDSATWQDVFEILTQQLEGGDCWELTIHNQMEQPKRWMRFKVCAPASFRCTKCRRWWTSGQVLILFHLTLKRRKRRGLVRMRIFKQECKHCSDGPFEEPEFTRENIVVVLSKLMNRIRKKCYGERSGAETEFSYDPYRRNEGPHETEHCEACREGVCNQGVDDDENIYEEWDSSWEQESVGSSFIWTASETNIYTHTPMYTGSPYRETPTHAPPTAVNISSWSGPQRESPSGNSSDVASLGSCLEIPPYGENLGPGLGTPPDVPKGGPNIRWAVFAFAVGAVLWWSIRQTKNEMPYNMKANVYDSVRQGIAKDVIVKRVIPKVSAESIFDFYMKYLSVEHTV